MNFGCNEALSQATNPAPRGAYRGRAPRTKIVPPQARTVPRRNLEARGYWSANRGPDWCFFGLTSDFKTFLGWRPFFFFWRSPVFSRKIPRKIGEDLFLFGDHLFSAGKTAWISDFGRKIPLNLWSSPCLFYPDWDKFLVPLLNSHK